MGLLGTKAGQEEGLLQGRMTPSKDKLAAGKSRASGSKEESFGRGKSFRAAEAIGWAQGWQIPTLHGPA